jgi:hypothetical protein
VWLALEERVDGLEEANLLFDGIATGLRYIEEEENTRLEVSESSD